MKSKKQVVPAIIKDIIAYLTTTEFTPMLIDDMIDIDSVATISVVNSKQLALSFEVRCSPMYAASLTRELVDFIHLQTKYTIDIYEPYALIFDDKETCIDVLWGEDAYDYMNNVILGGQEYLGPKEKKDEEDPQLKIDKLLDQITLRGLQSLDDKQKQFLADFSKKKSK